MPYGNEPREYSFLSFPVVPSYVRPTPTPTPTNTPTPTPTPTGTPTPTPTPTPTTTPQFSNATLFFQNDGTIGLNRPEEEINFLSIARGDSSLKVFDIRDVPSNTIKAGTFIVQLLAWTDGATWDYVADLYNNDTKAAIAVSNANTFTFGVGSISTLTFNLSSNVTWTNSLSGLQLRFFVNQSNSGTILRL
jgi:hypothetical protein